MTFTVSWKKLLTCTFVLYLGLIAWAMPAAAAEKEEPKPSASVGADILSQYIFRGVAFSKDSAVIQPSFTASYLGFSVNIWGNFDTHQKTKNPNLTSIVRNNDGSAKWNETDITVSYTRELFPNFSATVGNVYYSLTNAAFDANEIFGGISYTFPWLTTAFTAYREVTHTPGWWLQLDLTKSFPISCIEGMSLDVGATFGYFMLENQTLDMAGTVGDYSEPHSGTINAALKIPVHKYVTVAPKVGVAFPLSDNASRYIKANSFDEDDVHVFGGINLTASF